MFMYTGAEGGRNVWQWPTPPSQRQDGAQMPLGPEVGRELRAQSPGKTGKACGNRQA